MCRLISVNINLIIMQFFGRQNDSEVDILSLVHDFKSMGLEGKLESPEHCRDVAEPPDGGLSVCIDEDHTYGSYIEQFMLVTQNLNYF